MGIESFLYINYEFALQNTAKMARWLPMEAFAGDLESDNFVAHSQACKDDPGRYIGEADTCNLLLLLHYALLILEF